MAISHNQSSLSVTAPRVPDVAAERLLRRGLLSRLLASEASLVLVTAPAGYGKTTLLLQYAYNDPRPTAWLTLEAADNDQIVLLTRLWKALVNVAPLHVDHDAGHFEEGRPTQVLSAIETLLDETTQPFSLLLDDVHALGSPQAFDTLAAISMSIPAGSTLVLGSRTMPDIGIGGLRAFGRVQEVDAADLAFTATEAAALMRTLGFDPQGDELDHLIACTEGWATGLYLAAQSMLSGEGAAKGLSGADPLITDYFWDELLRSLPEPTVEFLLHSSVLQQLTGTACDALLGRNGSGALLRALHRSNIFIVATDRHQLSYRYHHLFAEALSAELHRRDPGLEVELHKRASRWYESQGNADKAILHATQAGSARRASTLIWAEISPISSPRAGTIERWLSEFSEREIVAHPPLALSMAWQFAQRGDGDGTDKWISVAERGYHRGRLPGGPATLAAAVNLLRAKLGREGIVTMTRDASQAYALDADHGAWRGVARYLQGMGNLLQGDQDAGLKALEECERRCRWSVPSTHAECLAQLALIAEQAGDRVRCHELAGRAAGLVDELRLRGEWVPPIVHAVSALVQAQEGNHLGAHAQLRLASAELARYSRFAPWLDAECKIVMARANMALSNGGEARRLVTEAGQLARQIPDAVLLHAWLDEIKQAVEEFPMPTHNGGASLTAAELRVLHLLPTHLSFPEIGMRLSLSRNTVKSQAISVYRKLGVGSRAKAVERASALGLLEETA